MASYPAQPYGGSKLTLKEEPATRITFIEKLAIRSTLRVKMARKLNWAKI